MASVGVAWERAGAAAGNAGGAPVWQPGPETGMERQDRDELVQRTLVAGLILEVILEAAPLPRDPDRRRQLLKSGLRRALVNRLAGQMPLHAFQFLARRLDDWFELYYHRLPWEWAAYPGGEAPGGPPLREELLADALRDLEPLLPKRRHRKLDRDRLEAFLRRTAGRWFRLRDFEEFFGIDRKTAWEYVTRLIQAGLLSHNQGRAAAARYRLSPRFVEE